MNIAYIMRGIPGSGKSTIAKKLIHDGGVIHSTDDFFYVNGEYYFDVTKIREYHNRNFEAFCQSMREGVPVVVCDNTNIMRHYFERYVEAARNAGYIVVFVILPHPDPEVAAQRTLHRVPSELITRMIEVWEN